MGDNKQKIRQRTRLYNENPFCPKCNVKMILPEEIGFIDLPNGNRKLKYEPKNLCTIEHKYTKLEAERVKPNYTNEIRHSLLCKLCNNLNGSESVNRLLTLEDKWERSGKRPLKLDYYIIKLPTIKIPKVGYGLNKLRLSVIDKLRGINE